MVLKNRLEITDSRELAEQEEFLTKSRAKELFDTGLIGQISVGTWEGLSAIHAFLFQDILRIRMEKAKELLRTSGDTIAEISEKVFAVLIPELQQGKGGTENEL